MKRGELRLSSTPALLRRLATQLENGENPAFLLCAVVADDDLRPAYCMGNHHFALLGLVFTYLNRMYEETERE